MNIVIAGPCGIGKSTIAQSFAQEAGLEFIDLDELRADAIDKTIKGFRPCSASKLNLRECLPPYLDVLPRWFVLDIGGDTVFRPQADNDERREQVLWLKRNYSPLLVILTAERKILFNRFSTGKKRDLSEFDGLWIDWKSIEEPYWFSCADLIVDTTTKSIQDTVDEIRRARDNAVFAS